MKKIILLLFFIQVSFSEKQSIDLITTNDLHGSIGQYEAKYISIDYPPKIVGGAGFYKYVKELRSELLSNDKDLLLLDGGNLFQGHPIGMINRGEVIIEWYNKLGYDAIVPGKDDFVFGIKRLYQLSKLADFPFLAANLNCEDCNLTSDNIKPYIIKKINNVNVGILGIISSDLDEFVPYDHRYGATFDSEYNTMQKYIPILKKKGADLIVILTSSGIPWDREEVYEDFLNSIDNGFDYKQEALNAIQLGRFAEGADIIVSGGQSKAYRTVWYDPYSHVYTFQNYGNGGSFTHVELDFKNNFFSGFNSVVDGRIDQSLMLDSFQPDPEINEWIQDWEKKALDYYYNDSFISSSQRSLKVKKTNFRNKWNVPKIGDEDAFEIITWNCEFFPAADDSTIEALSEIILDMDVDIIAFQEIRKFGWFSKMMNFLPSYSYQFSQQTSFMGMAIIYKTDKIKLEGHLEPFLEDDYNFAGRPPLHVDLLYSNGAQEFPISIINLHMKCCDSGLERRKRASSMLYEYVNRLYENNKNIIILGDWNDDLKDDDGEHCFDPFFNDEKFYFTNQKIVHDIQQASYPKEPYVSFLDHILTTESFVKSNSNYISSTIDMGTYMGGFDIYETYISDHLPVLFKVDLNNIQK